MHMVKRSSLPKHIRKRLHNEAIERIANTAHQAAMRQSPLDAIKAALAATQTALEAAIAYELGEHTITDLAAAMDHLENATQL